MFLYFMHLGVRVAATAAQQTNGRGTRLEIGQSCMLEAKSFTAGLRLF